jgi:hypothetical protein
LSYAVLRISIEGKSEFSRRNRFYKSGHNRNISDKKTKTKDSAAGSPFFVTFLAKQKSESRRATPGTLIQCNDLCATRGALIGGCDPPYCEQHPSPP